MSHWVNLSFSQKPCGCEGFFTAKHVPWVPRKLCQWQGLEVSGPEHSPRPGFPVTFWSSDNTNSRDGLKRELLGCDSRWPAEQHFTTVLWHVTWGVPLSDPKTLMGALPFVKQINYATKDCHIREACWHNWDFNLHFALYLFKRVKKRSR